MGCPPPVTKPRFYAMIRASSKTTFAPSLAATIWEVSGDFDAGVASALRGSQPANESIVPIVRYLGELPHPATSEARKPAMTPVGADRAHVMQLVHPGPV